MIALFLGYEGGVTGLTCGGDSGGPLVIFDSHKEQHIQVGVVSGGRCQSYNDPSIFARIEDHEILEFIMKQTWDNIPPTGRKAIEKLMQENKILKNDIQVVIDKNTELENDLVNLKNEVSKLSRQNKVRTRLEATINDVFKIKFNFLFSTFSVHIQKTLKQVNQ